MASREQDGAASRSARDEHATAAMAADLARARPAMQKAIDYARETATRSPPAGPASTWSRDNYARALLQFGYPPPLDPSTCGFFSTRYTTRIILVFNQDVGCTIWFFKLI